MSSDHPHPHHLSSRDFVRSLHSVVLWITLLFCIDGVQPLVTPTNICDDNIVTFRRTNTSCQVRTCAKTFGPYNDTQALRAVDRLEVPATIIGKQCTRPEGCVTSGTAWYPTAECPTCQCVTNAIGVSKSLVLLQMFNGVQRCLAFDCITLSLPQTLNACPTNSNRTNVTNIRILRYASSFFQPMAANILDPQSAEIQRFTCVPCGFPGNADLSQKVQRPRNASLFFVPTTQENPTPTQNGKCVFATCVPTTGANVQWQLEHPWNGANLQPVNGTSTTSARVIDHCDTFGFSDWNYCKFQPSEWVMNNDQCSQQNNNGPNGAQQTKLVFEACPRCRCAEPNTTWHAQYNFTKVKNNSALTEYFCDFCTCNAGNPANYSTCTRIAQAYTPFTCPPTRKCYDTPSGTPVNLAVTVADEKLCTRGNTCTFDSGVNWMDFSLYATNASTAVRQCGNDGLCKALSGSPATDSGTGCYKASVKVRANVGLQIWNCSNGHLNDLNTDVSFERVVSCNPNSLSNKMAPSAPTTCTASPKLELLTRAGLECAYKNVQPQNWLQDILQYVLCDTATLWSFNRAPCGDADIANFLNKYSQCFCSSLGAMWDGTDAGATALQSYFDFTVEPLLTMFRVTGCNIMLSCDVKSGVHSGEISTHILRFVAGFATHSDLVNRTLAKELIGKDLGLKFIEPVTLRPNLTDPGRNFQLKLNDTNKFLNFSGLFRVAVRYPDRLAAEKGMNLTAVRNMTGNIALLNTWSVTTHRDVLRTIPPDQSGVDGRSVRMVFGFVVLFVCVCVVG